MYLGGLVKFEPGDLQNMQISESEIIGLEVGFTLLNKILSGVTHTHT